MEHNVREAQATHVLLSGRTGFWTVSVSTTEEPDMEAVGSVCWSPIPSPVHPQMRGRGVCQAFRLPPVLQSPFRITAPSPAWVLGADT